MSGRSHRQPDPEFVAPSDYWMTYADLMANVLMVLGLIICISMLVSTALLDRGERRIRELTGLIEERIGVRRRIVEELKTRLADVRVEVDNDTGTVRIGDAVLFEQDRADLTSHGQQTLDSVMSRYVNVFFGSDGFTRHLSRIVIEGHTNDDGEYIYNLDLSQRRALSVMKYILERYGHTRFDEPLRKYMVASGRSEMDLRLQPDSRAVDKAASRRIEIKFSLRDDQSIKEIDDILHGRGEWERGAGIAVDERGQPPDSVSGD